MIMKKMMINKMMIKKMNIMKEMRVKMVNVINSSVEQSLELNRNNRRACQLNKMH
jgi:hypothetical protein